MDTPEARLDVGQVYYRCGCEFRNGKSRLVVSSWLYLGIVSHRCTTQQCDRPYHFYKFVELESYRASLHEPELKVNAALIPSLEQVFETMLDVETLAEDVAYWVNAIRSGTIDHNTG